MFKYEFKSCYGKKCLWHFFCITLYLFYFSKSFQICPDLSGKALGLDTCFSAFLVLIVGFSLGSIFFCIEILFGMLQHDSPMKSMLNYEDINNKGKIFYFNSIQCCPKETLWVLFYEVKVSTLDGYSTM